MQLKVIKKRDGRTENFDQSKLIFSLSQAIINTGLKDNPISGKLTKEVIKYLENNYSEDETVTTDDIRSAVNIVLLDNNHAEVAKVYFKTRGKKLVKEKAMASGIRQIKKRDGSIIDFDKDKIFSALFKSGQTSGEYAREEAQRLADVVTAILEHKFNEHLTPSVEQIQDIIEIILIQSNWASTAKHFILYREQRKKIRLEQGKEIISEEVKKLQEAGVNLSKQAKHIINNSTNFDELGRIIFLDRYSIKDKREDIEVGDLVIVITKEDRKYQIGRAHV